MGMRHGWLWLLRARCCSTRHAQGSQEDKFLNQQGSQEDRMRYAVRVGER